MDFLTNVNLHGNELQEFVVQRLSSAPSTPGTAQLYFDTTEGRLKVYTGTSWIPAGGLTGDDITSTLNSGSTLISSDNLPPEVVDAAEKRHVQNTDTGTSSATFQIAASGVKLKNLSGNLGVRNAADTGYADITVAGITGIGSSAFGDNAASDTHAFKGITSVQGSKTIDMGSADAAVFKVLDSASTPLFEVMENGDAKIAGVVTVSGTGTSTFAGDVSISGALYVAESTTATADMAGDNLTLTGNLNVHGNTVLGDDATVDTTTIKGVTSIYSGTTKALGNASTNVFEVLDSGSTPLFEVRETGDTVIGGVLTVNGTGDSSFAGNVNIGGSLTVEDTATVNAALTGDNLNLTGNLNVQGNTTLGNDSAVDTVDINGVTTISSRTTLALGGSTTPVFSVVDSQAAPLFEVMENGDAKIAGVVTVSGDGTSSFAGGVDFGGDVSISGSLDVAGDATVNAALAGDSLDLTGNLNVHGNTVLGDNAAEDSLTVKAYTEILGKTTLASGDPAANVFAVKDSEGSPLFEVRENGDANIAGTITISGDGTSTFAGDVNFDSDVNIAGNLTVEQSATANAALSGSDLTLTGNLVVQGNTTLGDASTDLISFIGKMGTDLAANGHKITGLATPTASGDATPKGYVDTEINTAVTTSTGTTSSSFQLDSDSSGARIKNAFGEMQIRNAADSDYADLRVMNLYVEGSQTSIVSNEVSIGDNEIMLNSDITESIQNSSGGVAIKRLQGDNTTRGDAAMRFDESSDRWTATYGDVNSVVTRAVALKYAEIIGDGVATEFVIMHDIGTRDVTVSVREAAAPYAQVFTDVEMTSENAVTVRFGNAPASSEYSVTVTG